MQQIQDGMLFQLQHRHNMKINFSFDTIYGKISDSLNVDNIQHTPTDDEIETMRYRRLDNWILSLTSIEVTDDGK